MRLSNLILLAGLALAAIGCGGGGAGGGGSTASGPLFMTDSLDNRDHVWVTVKKVALTGASGAATVFDDSAGKTIDLKTLRDASGQRFAFLGNAPSGTWTGVSVTVDKTVVLFPAGSGTGQVREFAGNNGATAVLSLTFATPRSIGSGGMAIDFDLASWDDNGTTVSGSPFLRESSGSGLDDPSRHEHEDFGGTIQGLGASGFNLVRGGRTVAVAITAQTVIFNDNGAPNPHLANGQRVEVQGVFSPSQNAIVADSIKIELEAGGGAEVRGPASSIGAGTFVLSVREARDFTPTSTEVNVVTGPGTVFISHGGMTLTSAEFFAALSNGMEVEVEGSYDAGTNTLTATKAKLEDGADDGEVKGLASAVNVPGGTFDVAAQQWQGLNLTPGQVVHVITNAGTFFDGIALSQITGGMSLEVEGDFNASNGTLTATRVKLDN